MKFVAFKEALASSLLVGSFTYVAGLNFNKQIKKLYQKTKYINSNSYPFCFLYETLIQRKYCSCSKFRFIGEFHPGFD